MSDEEVDIERRKFLTVTTAVVGGVGLGLASIPFVGSWLPSSKAQALGAPVEVDVSKIDEGQKVTVSWRGQPVFIVHRSQQSLDNLQNLDKQLRDPKSLQAEQPRYIDSLHRSIKEKFLVVIGICTHLGCVPVYYPKLGSLEAAWPGGFFCPCHGSKYDLAGRVYKGVPAPTNLVIPPHHYIDDKVLLIGKEG